MLNPADPSPGLLFASFLYHRDHHSQSSLQKVWDEYAQSSFYFFPTLNPLAKYYAKEMGEESKLERFFALATLSCPREKLLESKLWALHLESSFSHEQKRTVNVDTGILTAENFILATTKNYSHRVFIGQKIFADLTYQFHLGKFQTFPWTYPDYQDEEKIEFFTWGRSHLLTLLARSG